jgi:hypothetical protein
VNFIIAFVVVLVLIGVVAWAVRRFGAQRLDAAARARQPRLAVIDSASVDARRKLVIIRRDNVEHLLMIGGPTDVVVETNLVRGGAAPAREAPPVRSGAAESTLPRAMPLPDATPWPLQPEPAPAPMARQERRAAAPEPAAQWPHNEPQVTHQAAPPVPAQRPADTLAGLAAELAQPAEPPRAPAPRSAPQPVAQNDSPAAGASDQNLTEMAQRLEAALRRPMPQGQAAKPAATEPKPVVSARIGPKPAGAAPAKAAPAPAAPKAAAATAAKPHFESLEQEMASLLGRPGKT